jgi:hypothetical protein
VCSCVKTGCNDPSSILHTLLKKPAWRWFVSLFAFAFERNLEIRIQILGQSNESNISEHDLIVQPSDNNGYQSSHTHLLTTLLIVFIMHDKVA